MLSLPYNYCLDFLFVLTIELVLLCCLLLTVVQMSFYSDISFFVSECILKNHSVRSGKCQLMCVEVAVTGRGVQTLTALLQELFFFFPALLSRALLTHKLALELWRETARACRLV